MIGLEFIVKIKRLEYKDIANYLDISPQSVSDWIKGKRKVPLKRAIQLSEYFNISDELIGKELSEDEKLKLHYDLSEDITMEVTKDSDNKIERGGYNMQATQLALTILDENENDNICTTSDLEEKIKSEKRKIKINEADIMISQLKEMYSERGVIDVHPEFQRVFRWTTKQKSRFIESILLGIPIPPIFVAEDGDLNWDVIDGVQRLSTIFEFLGILKDDDGEDVEPTVLVETKTLRELDGKVWDNKFHKHKFSFEQSKFLQNAFLNATIKIIKIDSESDPKAKYDIFDRLNTGGTRLTNQEIRNCLAIMLNRNFYTWLRTLSYNPDFIECMPLGENAKKEQTDLEYVLRFFVYRNIGKNELSPMDDIGDVITEKMREFCLDKNFDYKKQREIFNKTFELLSSALGEDIFRKYDTEKDKYKGGITVTGFEIIAIGVANNLENILALENPVEHISTKVKELYNDSKYKELQKSRIASQRAVTRLSILTEYGTEYFKC